MKILIVEDDREKRLFLEYNLKKKNIEICLFSSVNPAIRYVVQYANQIDGIILDLGLTSYDSSDDYSFTKGLNLVKELTRKRIEIPILINSSTYVNLPNLMESNSNVKDQMYCAYDHTKLRWFINLLRKEQ